MEKRDFKRNAKDMIYLTACVINNRVPDKERTAKMNIAQLFEVCQEHSMTACTAYALESAGIHDHEFTQAKEKAIRKNILLDAERKKILARLEKEKIWYMPLKGAILKDYYPKLGMRQMSDNDILCAKGNRERIREIMLELGFDVQHFGITNDDAYFKQPVSNFEMHSELFANINGNELYNYYSNIQSRLIKDEGNEYGYHFSNEDFYIYLLAHEYKHYSTEGTGVRSLLDTYVFLRKFGDSLDWDYIGGELKRLGIAEYEKMNRELSMKVFKRKQLTDEDKKHLDYYIFSGTYGNTENGIDNSIEQEGSKLRYIVKRVFPPMEFYKAIYPWAYRHKILLPAAWFYRTVKAFSKHKNSLSQEIEYLNRK